MRVLHIDCSARKNNSISRKLSGSFIEKLKDRNSKNLEIDYLDLAENTPKHVTELFTQAMYTSPNELTESMINELAESNSLVDRMQKADLYVIAMPMYNFSVPSNFKAFIDNIVRIGRTFVKTEQGFEGALKNKSVVIISTRGADFNLDIFKDKDHLEPYLKTVFGYIGITDLNFINVQPIQFFGEEAKEAALLTAEVAIDNYLQIQTRQ
ncbi:NAD(P)H-dependent oxidoreductase [uncultured Croceitalea sp.]|uniref:FMN-dependent NADH-azoreductase n=1 Tax=uncultured Croceitalea sp. TaxID=1798908 RepID=UPI0033060D34